MTEHTDLPSHEERQMLRDSLRGFLERHWPSTRAVELAADPRAVIDLWSGLVGQGLASLGSDPAEGGLQEVVVAMEELGRAASPAPLLGAVLANLAFAQAGAPRAAQSLLADLHAGAARVCFAFAAIAPDTEAGSLRQGDVGVIGTLRFLEDAGSATHLVVATKDRTLAIVPCDAPQVRVVETPSMGGCPLYEATLADAPATLVPIEATRLSDLLLVARLALAARAHGAARKAFDMAVDYAKERRQFGQPIGRFQAIQHKLADGLIALEGVRLTLANAARNHDQGAADWRYFASTALAFAGGTLRKVSIETHHAFGAIGYAEEHEAPRHFRRVHVDSTAHGGAAQARKEVAASLFDQGGSPLPAYDLGPAGNAFRQQVRAWLAQHWSGERKATFDRLPFKQREFDASFARDVGKTGWIGLSWPASFGGQARGAMEQLAFIEEMERADAPRVGASVQANALMMFGTPEQQARYLPEILRGEAMHGMGYSEPNAGSDLASLKTRATPEPDGGWRIDGQKIWTTTYWGKYMFLAARTDVQAKPAHAGISMFVVPMDAPGITVNPAKTLYGGSFANIFYDGVKLPADALVGGLNNGWKVLTGALANERGLIGGGIVNKVIRQFEQLRLQLLDTTSGGRAMSSDPLVRERMATLASEIEVARQLMAHCATLAADGVTPPEVAAISKVFSGELMERFGEAALDLLGRRATLSQGASGALANGSFEQGLRHSLMWVISIGTNEIQRSLIAQRGLGLPR
ncbi:MAG: acyl-CoA dehydrogenase [Rhizobacter sp.]|nr:acyl-CoA dehydrogenase [Rhizobacter sp.]